MNISTHNEGDVRWYTFYDLNLRLPSVTSILGVIGKGEGLMQWAASQERELVMAAAYELSCEPPQITKKLYFERLKELTGKVRGYVMARDKAADIGKSIHARIEWEVKDELKVENLPECPALHPDAKHGYDSYRRWRDDVRFEPLMAEAIVYSRKYEYAGTIDWVANVDGLPTVGDWKRTKSIYLPHLLQVSAYIEALLEDDAMAPPLQGYVARLPRKADEAVDGRLITWQEHQKLFQVFLSCLSLFRFMHGITPPVAVEIPLVVS